MDFICWIRRTLSLNTVANFFDGTPSTKALMINAFRWRCSYCRFSFDFIDLDLLFKHNIRVFNCCIVLVLRYILNE